MQDDEPNLELLQFPYSHYNEKARWVLDFKGLPHVRTSFLPGPHAPAIKRLTGQTLVPVLRMNGRLVCGSAQIIDALEQSHPAPALYPSDSSRRTEALEIQRRFDAEVGPMVRRAIFSVLIPNPGYLCAMFAGARSAPVRVLYRASFPIARTMMKRSMGIADRASIDEAYRRTELALDFVAERAGVDGYLVGDAFTVADLTAAALLAPAANPPGSPMALPEPAPPAVRAWHQRWRGHPGIDWVRQCYRRSRSASSTTVDRCAPLGRAA